jgi:hypothetical protein
VPLEESAPKDVFPIQPLRAVRPVAHEDHTSLIDQPHAQTFWFLAGEPCAPASTTSLRRKEDDMDALQFPRCEIRVRFASELRDHLENDHPGFRADASTPAADPIDACHCHHGHPVGKGPHLMTHLNNAA